MQVGMMMMGVVDTLMVGRVSAADLAAVALGNLYFMSIAIFAMGILFSLDPVVSQAVGADDSVGVARGLQRGMLMATGLATLGAALLLPGTAVLSALGQPEDVVPIAAGYARAASLGVYPFLFYIVLRQTLQAMGRLAPIVFTVLVANVFNLIFNWAFVFGHLGIPAMGAVGTGWATTLSRVCMFAGLAALSWGTLGGYLRPVRPEVFRVRPLSRMLRLGVPIGVQMSLEYWAFGATSLLMGLLGTVALAGHQVAINMAALAFMVPLGIGQACAVLVGRAVGAGEPNEARRAGAAGLIVAVAFMTLTAVLFLSTPAFLARLYTPDVAVVTLAATLIPLAGVFQIFDGVQVVGAGVLRGIGDTRAPMVINVLGFWAIGLPVGFTLGFRTALGPRGLWWGLVTGLAVVAGLLFWRIRVRFGRTLERLDMDVEDTHR